MISDNIFIGFYFLFFYSWGELLEAAFTFNSVVQRELKRKWQMDRSQKKISFEK